MHNAPSEGHASSPSTRLTATAEETKRTEVVCSPGHLVIVELEDDASDGLLALQDVEVRD